ncbi:hypothetical protein JXA12_02740 [Candidatus Woesearchaeota archaeon]|nr:hypothetical protein [Candidatus Woesearchaeota archaeon]
MRLFLLSLLLFSSLSAACSPPRQVTLRDELAALDPPYEYRARQYAADTGLEEFNEQGSYEENTTFTVLHEYVEDREDTVMPQLAMQDVARELHPYLDLVEGQHPANKVRCYYYEDVGAERVSACFEGHAVTRFERVRTTGNLRKETLRWALLDD